MTLTASIPNAQEIYIFPLPAAPIMTALYRSRMYSQVPNGVMGGLSSTFCHSTAIFQFVHIGFTRLIDKLESSELTTRPVILSIARSAKSKFSTSNAILFIVQTPCMCLVLCSDYIIPYIGSALLFYFGFLIKKLEFLGVRSLSE